MVSDDGCLRMAREESSNCDEIARQLSHCLRYLRLHLHVYVAPAPMLVTTGSLSVLQPASPCMPVTSMVCTLNPNLLLLVLLQLLAKA